MRKREKSGDLTVQVVAGTYVIMLGMDLRERSCDGLLGFALHRHDMTERESYWLRGYKTFKSVEPNPPKGVSFSTRIHPIQGFSWSDFTAKPGHEYSYKIVALKGKPHAPVESQKVEVAVSTEEEDVRGNIHHVHFNRGAAASQEYTRRFGDRKPDRVGPAAYDWLSRGAAESILSFIERAKNADWSLRILAYEFTDDKVLGALKEAWQKRNVDVRILYHARNDDQKVKNEKKIEEFGLGNICQKRNAKGLSLSHNKVIILVKSDRAKAVLTGSTNFSEGGIYGHSNVVHVCEDTSVAEQYLWLWDKLKGNNDKKDDDDLIAGQTPLPQVTKKAGTIPIFSPRPDLEALEWYAKQAKEARNALFMTFAFGMHPFFQDAYRNGSAKLRYALMEKMSGPTRTKEQREKNEKLIIALRKMQQNKFAIGAHIRENSFDHWLGETLTGLNSNVRYLHTKYMLVDPLSNNPLVVSGSANFSKASSIDNDENMLIIRGDSRVSDIYLGEFMRMYNHFAFRDWMSSQSDPQNARLKYLDEKNTWWKAYFGDTFASHQREYFAGIS